MCGVYKITNTINGLFYIGSTGQTFRKRWYQHRYQLRNKEHGNPHLQNAWNLYGEDKFEFSVLQVCPKEMCLDVEQDTIDTLKPDYNIAKYTRPVVLDINGVPMSIADASKEFGTSKNLIRTRNYRGWKSDDLVLAKNEKKPPIEIDGVFKSIRGWAKLSGVCKTSIQVRLKQGWSVKDAVFTPANDLARVKVTAFGQTLGVTQWARKTGISRDKIQYRLDKGISPELIFTDESLKGSLPCRKRKKSPSSTTPNSTPES